MTDYAFLAAKRRYVIMMSIFLAFMCLVPIVSAAFLNGEQIAVPVRATDERFIHRKEQAVPGGDQFYTGLEGDLWHTPKSFGEVMLLQTFTNPGIDFLTSLQIVIVVGMSFWIFRKSTTQLILTKKMLTGLFLLGVCIIISNILFDLARGIIASQYMAYVTHGQFKGNYRSTNTSVGFYIMPVLIFLMQIPQKGLELQKEADLTI